MKKNLSVISILILGVTLISFVVYPTISPALGMIALFFSLALSTYTIIHRHAGTKHARAKILKDAGVMVLTLSIILFLGGIAAMLANAQVSVRWGEAAGLLSALGASFLVGYLVRVGMLKLGG